MRQRYAMTRAEAEEQVETVEVGMSAAKRFRRCCTVPLRAVASCCGVAAPASCMHGVPDRGRSCYTDMRSLKAQ